MRRVGMTVRGEMLPPSGGRGVAPLSMTNAADGAVARQCRIADAAFSYAKHANIKAARMGEVFGRSWQTGAVNDEVRIKITKCHKRLFNVDAKQSVAVCSRTGIQMVQASMQHAVKNVHSVHATNSRGNVARTYMVACLVG